MGVGVGVGVVVEEWEEWEEKEEKEESPTPDTAQVLSSPFKESLSKSSS